MAENPGRGSNLTDEDRAKGGENSHGGGRSSQDEQYNSDVSNNRGNDKNSNFGTMDDSESSRDTQDEE